MQLLSRSFRTWWQKSRPIADVPDKRTVSFLELFYDLAYVVIIIQLTHTLAGHLDLTTFFEYVGLYALVWFAWVNGTLYHELHGNNDIRSRVFTFAQMFALLWMAIFVDSGFSTSGYVGFSYAYAGFLAVITYLWWRTGIHDPSHRPLSTPYATAALGATAAFIVAAQVSAATAQLIWFGAAGYMLMLPFLMAKFRSRADEKHVEQAQRIRHPLVERFGLLTIIILGENLISIVGGAVYRDDFAAQSVGIISASILIVFLLWWIYFDLVSGRLPIQKQHTRTAWMYLHLGVTMSIGLVAVGLLNAIEYTYSPKLLDPVDTWFIVGPIAAFLVVIILLIRTIQTQKANWPVYVAASRASATAVIGLLVVGYLELSIVATIGFAVVLLALPVLFAFLMWIKRNTPSL